MEFKKGHTVELTRPISSIGLVGVLGIGTRGILVRLEREEDGLLIWSVMVGTTLWSINEQQMKAV